MDQQMVSVLLLLFGFLSGLVVGWVQGSAPQKRKLQGLELDLVQLRAQHSDLERELDFARESESETVKELAQALAQVSELQSQLGSVLDSEMELLPESEKELESESE